MRMTLALILTFLTLGFLPKTSAQRDTEPQLPTGIKLYTKCSGKITGNIQYSPDGKELAVASNMGIWIYDARTGAEVALLSGHDGEVKSVAYSPDSKMLASAGLDKTIRLWNPQTGENLATLTGHNGFVMSVAFSPDGKRVFSASGDATVRLWSTETYQPIWSTGTPQRGRRAPRVHGFFGVESDPTPAHQLAFQWALAAAYSPDGQTLASSGSSDGTVQLWEVNIGRHIRTLKGHTDMVKTLAFSPDGKTLVSGSDDDTLRMWDVATGRMLRRLAGHNNDITAVAFSRDGKLLVSGSTNASVRLWDAKTGRFLPTLRGHSWGIKGVAFGADGKTVATGDDLGTILFWDWKELEKK